MDRAFSPFLLTIHNSQREALGWYDVAPLALDLSSAEIETQE
jgi:hypothetical protein